MKQYFLTIDCEVIEYEMKFTTQSASQFDDYRVVWKKGNEKYRNDSAGSFNARAKFNLSDKEELTRKKKVRNCINISKEIIDLLGLK